MIKALLGLRRARRAARCACSASTCGTSPLAIRARIGYMPESDAHIPGMNAVSFVAYCGELAGLPRADAMQRAHEVLYYVGLGEARYRNVETYSTGMKQRIKLAQALVHDPDLLFLDEPTNGMDPKGRDEMLELIRDIAHNKGLNLILSSHLLPDVEYTCDHVVVHRQGRGRDAGADRRAEGARRPRVRAAREGRCRRFVGGAARRRPRVPRDRRGRHARVRARTAAAAATCSSSPRSIGVQVRHLRPSVPTLEDVFARAVGRMRTARLRPSARLSSSRQGPDWPIGSEPATDADPRSGISPLRGRREPHGRRWWVIARAGIARAAARAALPRAAALRVVAVPRARRADLRGVELHAGRRSSRRRPRRSASSSISRASSCSSSRSTSAPA